MGTKHTGIIVNTSNEMIDKVYAAGRKERLATLVDLYPETISAENFSGHVAAAENAEVAFSTWGMPQFTPEQLNRMGKLKVVFYAAGSVRGFAPAYLERGIRVVSAWGANAVPVAEFALAQILLSAKGYFRNVRDCRTPEIHHGGTAFRGNGNFGERVALIGAGMIGRKVIALLKLFALEVVVVDPYLGDDDAAKLGVAKVTLEEAFATAYVVSNHLPNIPPTVGLLNKSLFARMRLGATFVNTARGAQVIEADLIEVLRQRSDLMALLDVTDPEPPAVDSAFYQLPNVLLSSHIAGSMNHEVIRMADYMLEEFANWREGRPLRYEVTPAMLPLLA